MNSKFLNQLKQLVERLTLQQKLGLAGVTAVALGSLIFLMIWANRPEYGLLFSKMDPADASEIVDELKSSNTPYQLRDGGTTVLVPSSQIYELRLKYSGQNPLTQGSIGYEIFDRNSFGLTDFMQKVNLRRALEGELSKTINQIEGIQQSRVHLVMPERTLFEEQQNRPSSSVVLRLRPNFRLSENQVAGIMHMVSSSIEGLGPENVTIIDTHGNILTEAVAGQSEIGLSNNQFELKQKVERYLNRNAQGMLDRVLGKGNAIVKVSADLIFSKIRRTSEKYDPDNTAVLSEEKSEQTSTQNNNTIQQSENTISNYEINKSVEEYESSVGDIQRLTIAVFLNRQDSTEQASELDETKIAEIVKHAVGFKEERNDKIMIHKIHFDNSFLADEKEALELLEKRSFWTEIIRYGLIALAGLVVLVFIRATFKKIGGQTFFDAQKILPAGGAQAAPAAALSGKEGDDIYLKKLSPAAQAKLQEQDVVASEVLEFTEKDPEQATSLLRYWLLEGEQSPS